MFSKEERQGKFYSAPSHRKVRASEGCNALSNRGTAMTVPRLSLPTFLTSLTPSAPKPSRRRAVWVSNDYASQPRNSAHHNKRGGITHRQEVLLQPRRLRGEPPHPNGEECRSRPDNDSVVERLRASRVDKRCDWERELRSDVGEYYRYAPRLTQDRKEEEIPNARD